MKLTLEEAARFLNVSAATVERWARQGTIPVVRRSGGEVFFVKEELLRWARERRLVAGGEQEPLEFPVDSPRAFSLGAAMERGGALYRVPGEDMPSVLAAVTSRMQFPENFQKALLGHLLAREALSSTGIGKGVAIPHPRTPLPGSDGEPSITTCFLSRPVPWNSIDDKPVFVLFLLLCPSVQVHLQMLSRLAFCLRDEAFVAFLWTTPEVPRLAADVTAREKALDRAGTR